LEELSGALTAKLAEACRLARQSEVSAEALTEMKNPLIAILGYTQMLLQRVSDRRFKFLSTKSMRYLGIIEEEAKRCVEIATRLMSLSEQKGIRDAAKINDVLPNVAALLRPQCSLSGIELRTMLLKRDVVVDVPYDDTHTILVNLVLNSMEAIKGAGEISLKGYEVPAGTLLLTMASEQEREFMDGVSEKSLVAVEVSDTGRGIDPKHVDRIFDLFFTTKTDSPGAGIGLAVCKEKVELSGGHMAVVSTGASGTTMRVLLPVSTLV
jgi:signal transduction histidine kinase